MNGRGPIQPQESGTYERITMVIHLQSWESKGAPPNATPPQ